jgi:hypothetical protein
MFIVTSVHALAILLWRVRTKLTKLVSIGAAHHFKLILVAIVHCYTLVLRWVMAQLKSIRHRDKKVKLVLEAVTHVLWLWMMRSKLDGIKSNVRLVVVITTTFLYMDPMPLLPVTLWRVRTKLTKLVSIGAAHHFKLILVAIVHCYTLVFRWVMAQLKSIHRDKKVRLVLEQSPMCCCYG